MSNISLVRLDDLNVIKESLKHLADSVSNQSSNPKHIILTNSEAAEKLGVSTRQLYRWRQAGIIKYSQIGREIFYKLSDILEMLDRYVVNPII